MDVYKRKVLNNDEEYGDFTLNQITRKDLISRIRKIIETLPPVRRQVIILSCVNGLSREEIAQELKISPNTVRNHKARGLKWLKQRFENDGLIA